MSSWNRTILQQISKWVYLLIKVILIIKYNNQNSSFRILFSILLHKKYIFFSLVSSRSWNRIILQQILKWVYLLIKVILIIKYNNQNSSFRIISSIFLHKKYIFFRLVTSLRNAKICTTILERVAKWV